MTRTEFKRCINKAERNLNVWHGTAYRGVCGTLRFSTSKRGTTTMVDMFNYLYNKDGRRYWLGERNEKNHATRITYLRLFEQVCLDDLLYEGF